MKYIVTGGAGFIGSHIAEALVKRNEKVVIIDNLLSGRIENIESLKNKIEFIKGDILDIELLNKTFEEDDIIFHEAARPSVVKSIENPQLTNKINIEGTLNVLTAAKDKKCKRVIFASSSSVYGDSETLPKVETMHTNPKSPYALTKYSGEAYLKLFYKLYGLETLSIRYFNVFGPRQDPNSEYSAVIPKFIKMIKEDKQPIIFGDGLQSRDFSYITNVVNANLLAADAKETKGEIINVACGTRINLIELVDKLNILLGKNLKPIFKDERKGDVKHSLADIKKAKELIDYSPLIDIDEGLKLTVESFENN